MVFVHAPPFSKDDKRAVAAWKILRMALERTRSAYGDFRIEESSSTLVMKRQLLSLEVNIEPQINIAFLPVSEADAENGVVPVRIPAYGGLWGYRVFLISDGSEPKFSNIESLADLKGVTIGESESWPDTAILRAAGLQIVTGESYEGLFKMLAGNRFDALNRSITEVMQEWRTRSNALATLKIERHILLHYPMPEYFWFRDDEQGRRLAHRVQDGLMSMVADHSLCREVAREFGQDIQDLNLNSRTVIEIPNPTLGAEDHVGDPAYWCSPLRNSWISPVRH